jgi:hypothetical protein
MALAMSGGPVRCFLVGLAWLRDAAQQVLGAQVSRGARGR